MFVAVACLAAWVAGAEGQAVAIPAQSFQVSLNISNQGSQSLALGWQSGVITAAMYCNSQLQSWRLDETVGPVPYVGGNIYISAYANANGGDTVIDDVCKGFGSSYGDGLFSWSKYGTALGTSTIRGHTCTGYRLDVPQSNVNLTLWNTTVTLPTGTYNVPVRWNVQNFASFLPGAPPSYNNITYEFNVSTYVIPMSLPPSTFDIPESCSEPARCKGGTATNASIVQVVPMVVAQPAYEISGYNISNQDTADWIGDSVFTCLDVLSNHTDADEYSVVSLFEVEVDTRWGPYALCNGYPGVCTGNSSTAVGRQSSMGVGSDAMQCDNTTATGAWYSLPAAGECTEPEQFVGKSCTWRVLRRVRTVSIKCLFESHGMRGACQQATDLQTLDKATEILKAALTQPVGMDPGTGCPDIPPPTPAPTMP